MFALAGCSAGLAGATLAAPLLRSQLYAIQPFDPLTYAAVAALMLTAAVAACWLPARRATAISPMEALRAE